MKWIILLLSLGTCFTSCQHPVSIDINNEDEANTPSDSQPHPGSYHYQGTFDLGAETITLDNHSGRLPQICNLAIYFRPRQYITHMGGHYPTLFFLIKDVYPNDNPEHFIYESEFELKFTTDEPCGDEFDLLDVYGGPWEDQHAFLAAVLHPSLIQCWPEGTFSFRIATNFLLECTE